MIFSPLFHIIVNSLIVFTVVALGIEIVFLLFRVKNPRVKSLVRLLPILKMPLDVFFYLFIENSYFMNFNPFSCEKYLLDFLVPGTAYCSLPAYFLAQLHPYLITIFMTAFLVITCGMLGYRLLQIVTASRYLKHVKQHAVPCAREVTSPELHKKLNELKIELRVSDKVLVPFVSLDKIIFLPLTLVEHLSTGEYDAIVAHELEHIRWKDPLIKHVSRMVCALFWWVPTLWWMRTCELDQEMSCDRAIDRYGIEGSALATGMVAVMKEKKTIEFKMSAICHAATPSTLRLRILSIFEPQQTNLFIMIVSTALCIAAASSFWIC